MKLSDSSRKCIWCGDYMKISVIHDHEWRHLVSKDRSILKMVRWHVVTKRDIFT